MTDSTCFKSFSIYRESISAYDTTALDQSYDVFDSLIAGSEYNIENSVYPYILSRPQSGLDGGRECQFTCDRWRISVRRKDREKEDALELMCNITREKS
ncbi:hypothetical protein Goarm_015652 [Gossypium armourianum]|uniref:Uncharacterized protein n=1 Tax=Gossypium armourianum TaxID=34283 RepID=A0A7J9JB35_9ROSI|nr:hypothetical protein [Gossypium armourianum]